MVTTVLFFDAALSLAVLAAYMACAVFLMRAFWSGIFWISVVRMVESTEEANMLSGKSLRNFSSASIFLSAIRDLGRVHVGLLVRRSLADRGLCLIAAGGLGVGWGGLRICPGEGKRKGRGR